MSLSIAPASSPSCNWSGRREGPQPRPSSKPLIAAVPYKIHTVLTDNGIQFTFPPRYADGPTARYVTHVRYALPRKWHRTSADQDQASLDQWSGRAHEPHDQGSQLSNATITTDTISSLKAHLADFINAYNYARLLKPRQGLTPYEYICKSWTTQPERFKTQSAPENAGTKHLARARSNSCAAARRIGAAVKGPCRLRDRSLCCLRQHMLPKARHDLLGQ